MTDTIISTIVGAIIAGIFGLIGIWFNHYLTNGRNNQKPELEPEKERQAEIARRKRLAEEQRRQKEIARQQAEEQARKLLRERQQAETTHQQLFALNPLDYLRVPLFIVILILYHVMLLFGFTFDGDSVIFSMGLPSGAEWSLTASNIFIMLSVITLYIELIPCFQIADIAFSMVVFLAFLMDFIFFKGAGTSTFLIVTLMSLLIVVGQFSISALVARRDFNMMREW